MLAFVFSWARKPQLPCQLYKGHYQLGILPRPLRGCRKNIYQNRALDFSGHTYPSKPTSQSSWNTQKLKGKSQQFKSHQAELVEDERLTLCCILPSHHSDHIVKPSAQRKGTILNIAPLEWCHLLKLHMGRTDKGMMWYSSGMFFGTLPSRGEGYVGNPPPISLAIFSQTMCSIPMTDFKFLAKKVPLYLDMGSENHIYPSK